MNLIFLHGVNQQVTGYSSSLYNLVLKAYKKLLVKNGLKPQEAQDKANQLVQKELLWADVTTDLTNRYLTLEFGPKKRSFLCNLIAPGIDPIVIQILYYLKDKGDRASGTMNILGRVDAKFKEYQKDGMKECVIVAHSLGSVIAFDYVFGFRKYMLDPSVTVKAFITLGSPIPIFTTSMGHTESDLKLPSNVKQWINILDKDDAIARYCRPFFKNIDIREIEVDTGMNPIRSHGYYWYSKPTAKKIAEIIGDIQI
jgi:hypothetical protein